MFPREWKRWFSKAPHALLGTAWRLSAWGGGCWGRHWMERSWWDDAFGDLEALSEGFSPFFLLPNPSVPIWSCDSNLRTKTSLPHWVWCPPEAPLWGRKVGHRTEFSEIGGRAAGGLCVLRERPLDGGGRLCKPTAPMPSFPGRPIWWAWPEFTSELSFLVVPGLTSCPSGQNIPPGFIELASSHFEPFGCFKVSVLFCVDPWVCFSMVFPSRVPKIERFPRIDPAPPSPCTPPARTVSHSTGRNAFDFLHSLFFLIQSLDCEVPVKMCSFSVFPYSQEGLPW